MFGKLLEDIGMYRGVIFTPKNSGEIIGNVTSVEKNSYGLLGCMSPAMRQRIDDNPEESGWQFTVMQTRQKQAFFVLAIQSGASQARFLADLQDPEVLRMLNWSAVSGYLQVLLTVPEKIGCFHFRPRVSSENVENILKLGRESKRFFDKEQLMGMAIAATQLKKDTESIVCGEMPDVNDVVVNSILWNTTSENRSKFVGDFSTIH